MKMSQMTELIKSKIINLEKIEKLFSEEFRFENTIVFTNGCFDVFHPGHHHLLTNARKMGDILVVGLNSDDSVKRLKGPSRPFNKQDMRAFTLASKDYVDFVILFSEDNPEVLIRAISPDVLVKGGDYKENEIAGYDFVTSHGGIVTTIPLLKGYSSTKLIDKNKKD